MWLLIPLKSEIITSRQQENMGVDTDQDISDPKARVAEVEAFFQRLQQDIVSSLEAAGAGNFVDDSWESTLGTGRTMVVSGAGSLERGAVNYSRVSGDSLPAAASAARPQLAGLSFDAMGVSVVLHPSNPYAPTVHMNVRFFIAGHGGRAVVVRRRDGSDAVLRL